MADDDLVNRGDAIEGAKVNGSSRKPLLHRGLTERNGTRCWAFVGSFDVKAKIAACLPPDGRRIFEPTARTDMHCEVTCEKAAIHSMDDTPSSSVEPRTARHQATFWRFAEQTAVRVDTAHEELVNAIRNKARTQVALLPAPEAGKKKKGRRKKK